MCSYKVLFHKSSGYVVKCNSCSHYQVAFGMMIFTISTDNMHMLFEKVTNLRKRKQVQGDRSERFRIQLPCESVALALNADELRLFHGMLDEAFAAEELKELLKENNIGK